MPDGYYNSLKNDILHNLKTGDYMFKIYGNKKIKFKFMFNKDGRKLKDILEEAYHEQISNEKLLLKESSDLQNYRIGDML